MNKPTKEPIQIVFDGPPGPTSGRFIEVERGGRSLCLGEWRERDDGYWVLEFYPEALIKSGAPQTMSKELVEKWSRTMGNFADLNYRNLVAMLREMGYEVTS